MPSSRGRRRADRRPPTTAATELWSGRFLAPRPSAGFNAEPEAASIEIGRGHRPDRVLLRGGSRRAYGVWRSCPRSLTCSRWTNASKRRGARRFARPHLKAGETRAHRGARRQNLPVGRRVASTCWWARATPALGRHAAGAGAMTTSPAPATSARAAFPSQLQQNSLTAAAAAETVNSGKKQAQWCDPFHAQQQHRARSSSSSRRQLPPCRARQGSAAAELRRSRSRETVAAASADGRRNDRRRNDGWHGAHHGRARRWSDDKNDGGPRSTGPICSTSTRPRAATQGRPRRGPSELFEVIAAFATGGSFIFQSGYSTSSRLVERVARRCQRRQCDGASDAIWTRGRSGGFGNSRTSLARARRRGHVVATST